MVTDIDFADDVVLTTDMWQVLAALVVKMEEVTQRMGINNSGKKIEVMMLETKTAQSRERGSREGGTERTVIGAE